ncbi:MAG: hypothetical protein LN414_03095, partial [Candidatus Thermoplasmatota archaeon]|nr:hypothetical protein [Candidatus Thermoplasmatota archaeon]
MPAFMVVTSGSTLGDCRLYGQREVEAARAHLLLQKVQELVGEVVDARGDEVGDASGGLFHDLDHLVPIQLYNTVLLGLGGLGDQDGDVARVFHELVDHPALQDVVTGDDDEVAIQVFAGCEQGMAGSQLAPLLHVLDIDA